MHIGSADLVHKSHSVYSCRRFRTQFNSANCIREFVSQSCLRRFVSQICSADVFRRFVPQICSADWFRRFIHHTALCVVIMQTPYAARSPHIYAAYFQHRLASQICFTKSPCKLLSRSGCTYFLCILYTANTDLYTATRFHTIIPRTGSDIERPAGTTIVGDTCEYVFVLHGLPVTGWGLC